MIYVYIYIYIYNAPLMNPINKYVLLCVYICVYIQEYIYVYIYIYSKPSAQSAGPGKSHINLTRHTFKTCDCTSDVVSDISFSPWGHFGNTVGSFIVSKKSLEHQRCPRGVQGGTTLDKKSPCWEPFGKNCVKIVCIGPKNQLC